MTVSLISGAEQNITDLEFDGGSNTGPAVVVTSPVHGGTYAYQFAPSANIANVRFRIRAAGGTNRALFRSCRFYLNIAALTNANGTILCGAGAAAFSAIGAVFSLALNSTGTLVVQESGGTNNVSTNALTADNLWHRIEFDVGWNSGAGARVFVDGVQWASFSTVTLAAQVEGLVGMDGFANTSNVYVDDIVWDDSTLGGSVGYDWQCKLLLPVADPGALNSWTVAGGGTSNLWDSVNNIPPTDAVTAGNSIVNAASGGNLDYVATMQSYKEGGLGIYDKVRSVIAMCRDAEDITTGTKSGGVWIASNPSQTAGGGLAFDYGDDYGVAKNFRGHVNSPVVNPSVTLTTRPTVGVRKTTSTTRQVDVDFLGIYVEYTPAPVGLNEANGSQTGVAGVMGQQKMVSVNRSSVW